MTRARIVPIALVATLALASPAQAAESVKGTTGNDKIFVKRKGAKLRWRAVAPSGQVGTATLHRV
jgi:hypothetical protein